MSDHLSAETLSALADAELSPTQMQEVNEHLAACPACTRHALEQSLLKAATARAGQRYSAPEKLRDRMERLAAAGATPPPATLARRHSSVWSPGRFAAAALVLVAVVISGLFWRTQRNTAAAALATEACDQHIAMLAGNAPPEVVSSDRHTVKPWFQGKLPFSFNLPQSLPADTTLDGANLRYLHGQPAAQLLFSIGRHRASVFVRQSAGGASIGSVTAEHAGFHVREFRAGGLEGVAVSDAEDARLVSLVDAIRDAQR